MIRLLILIFQTFLIGNIFAQCCRCSDYGPELVYNGNFSLGNTGFTTAYLFSTNASPGRYGITTNSNLANPFYWGNCFDHTNGTGNLIWYDLSSSSNINMWSQQITGIAPNSNYLFSCWINTLDPSGPAILRFSINGQLVGNTFTAPTTLCNWVQKCFVWNSGNNLSANITITNQSTFASGNDVGVDDISFRQCSSFSFIYPEVFICDGKNYQLPNGTIVNTAGTYIDTLHTTDGCDSLRISTIKVKAVRDTTLTTSICNRESYLGYNTTGIYIDTLTATNGCDSIRTLNLTVKPGPISNFKKFYTITEGDSVILKPDSPMSAGLTYLWAPSTYLDNPSAATPKVINPLNDIDYNLILTENGCSLSTIVKIYIQFDLVVPNTFTPNNDNVNDKWQISGIHKFPDHKVQVFTRAGQIVYETLSYPAEGWDGKYKNKPLPFDTYYYLIELGGSRYPRSGYVTIVK